MSSGKPLTREIVEVILPVLSVVLSQRMQILPAVNAGRVQVVEDEAHGVIADWVHFQYRHLLLSADGFTLVRRMPLHLGARAFHPQIFRAEIEGMTVIEGNGKGLAVLVQPQFRRPGISGTVSHISV